MKFFKKTHVMNLTLKEKRVGGRVKSMTIFSYLGVAAIILVFVLGYLWIRMQVLKTGFEIEKIKKQCSAIRNLNKHKEVEFMSMASLRSIEQKSRRIDMAAPSKDRIVFIVDDEKQGVWSSVRNLLASPRGSE